MTNDELFVKSLQNYKNQLKEERADMTRTDGDNGKIAEWYDETIGLLEKLLPGVHEIFDLYEMDEESFVFLIDCLENYSEAFIIDNRDPKLKRAGEMELEQLTNILDEFYDDGDDEEDDDDDLDDDLDDDEDQDKDTSDED